MSYYLNRGNGGFQESVDSMIYVDKTGLIEYTNSVLSTEQRFVCVSHPRRFGKTMAAEMLEAYYCRTCDSHAQFDGLEISKSEKYEPHIKIRRGLFHHDERSVWCEGHQNCSDET